MDFASAAQWLDEQPEGEWTMSAQHGMRRRPRVQESVNILTSTSDAMRSQAEVRDVAYMTLLSRLLDILAEDETLIDNILDGEMPKRRG